MFYLLKSKQKKKCANKIKFEKFEIALNIRNSYISQLRPQQHQSKNTFAKKIKYDFNKNCIINLVTHTCTNANQHIGERKIKKCEINKNIAIIVSRATMHHPSVHLTNQNKIRHPSVSSLDGWMVRSIDRTQTSFLFFNVALQFINISKHQIKTII